jgi:uncharacterized protein YndB with AHSA1/START domain
MNQPDFEPGPLADVDCHNTDGRWALVFTKEFRHVPEKVWAALTDPDQLGKWAPYTADRDLSSTGDVTLTMIVSDSPTDLSCTVTRSEPVTLLEHSWGDATLRWELTPTESGTKLALHQTTPDKGMIAKAAAGWHLCLRVAEHLLDGDPIPPIRGYDAMNYGWEELNKAYADRLGVSEADAQR